MKARVFMRFELQIEFLKMQYEHKSGHGVKSKKVAGSVS
jgi:hypothetical protein